MERIRYIERIFKVRYFRLACMLLLLQSSQTLYHPIFAQTGNSPRIKHFTMGDGRPFTPYDMLKDRSGFVWIASGDGLSRFDGKEFKYFWHDPSDSTSISGNNHYDLYEDKKGKIWVSSGGNVLDCYDPLQDTFTRIKLQTADDSQSITDFLVEDNGTIWVTTVNTGLYRLSPTEDDSYSQEIFLPNQKLTAISMDSKGNIWVGSLDGEVFMFNRSLHDSFPAKSHLKVKGAITNFYHTGKNVLIGSGPGLYVYNLESKEAKLFDFELENDYSYNAALAFLKEDSNKVWVGAQSGLYLLNLKENKVIQKIAVEDGTNKVAKNEVRTLIRLSNTQLLAGSLSRLNLIDFSEPSFNYISNDGSDENQLSNDYITAIQKDGDDIWLGTLYGGLNLIRNGKIYHFLRDWDDPGSISGSSIRGIAKDYENESLWIATSNGVSMVSLKTFDPDKPEFTGLPFDRKAQDTLSPMQDVAVDQNGNIWGATSRAGIFRLEQTKEGKIRIVQYKNEEENINSLASDFTYTITVDKNNTIWISTSEGLSRLTFASKNYEQPKFTSYSKESDKKKSLSDNIVTDIVTDAKKRLWLGTNHGLNLFLGNNKFETWTAQKQFPYGFPIGAIQEDTLGNLWLSSANDIVKFDPEKEIFTTYGSKDGLPNKEFVAHSKFRDTEGTLYFGAREGLVYFHPDNLEKIDPARPLYFSELRIKDSIINSRNTPKSILKQSLLRTNRLEFRHDQFPFYLQFSSIDFRLDKNVEYGYKLLPADKEWNMLTDPEIQFLNLPSGNHTLLVNGFSRGKVWTQAPLKMELQILPPWWATWWAYALYALLALTLAYWLYRFQLSRKLAVSESLRLTEVNQLKNSLYTNITHEFRTPLTVILGVADNTKSILKEKRFDEAEESLNMIQRNGKNLLRLVNEMLDLAKLEGGTLELQSVQADIVPFVNYICESFHSMAKAVQIDLTVYSEIDELIMDIDANKLTAVISNLLSNAIKFTLSNGKIVVHLNKIAENGKEHFFIRIKDDGLGISEEALPHIFDRFYQENASSSRKVEGTGIGLALTKELVELMKGSIIVKSTLGKGSEFTIQIPITKNAPKTTDVRSSNTLDLYGDKIHIPFEEALNHDSQFPLLLIIEDNADVAHYLKTCLQEKYEILYAADGVIGIETAFEKMPDIIICDVMMPGKDGYEVCTTLKSDERTDHIPIIMLTAKVTQQDRITGFSHGADAYLAKPFDKIELFTRLDQLIQLRQKMVQKFEREGFGKFLMVRAENPEAKFLKKAVRIIHEEMGNHSFGSRHLARQLSMSESQIYRKLKAVTGKSTAIFIRSVRLQKAKELIQNTNSNISEVAYDVGFNDPSWFSRAFKEEFGFSPSELYK